VWGRNQPESRPKSPKGDPLDIPLVREESDAPNRTGPPEKGSLCEEGGASED